MFLVARGRNEHGRSGLLRALPPAAKCLDVTLISVSLKGIIGDTGSACDALMQALSFLMVRARDTVSSAASKLNVLYIHNSAFMIT